MHHWIAEPNIRVLISPTTHIRARCIPADVSRNNNRRLLNALCSRSRFFFEEIFFRRNRFRIKCDSQKAFLRNISQRHLLSTFNVFVFIARSNCVGILWKNTKQNTNLIQDSSWFSSKRSFSSSSEYPHFCNSIVAQCPVAFPHFSSESRCTICQLTKIAHATLNRYVFALILFVYFFLFNFSLFSSNKLHINPDWQTMISFYWLFLNFFFFFQQIK